MNLVEEYKKARVKYIKETVKIMCQIKDVRVLIKIYTVAKTHLSILQEKGGTT